MPSLKTSVEERRAKFAATKVSQKLPRCYILKILLSETVMLVNDANFINITNIYNNAYEWNHTFQFIFFDIKSINLFVLE